MGQRTRQEGAVLQTNITQGLNNAKELLKGRQDNIKAEQSSLAASPQSNLSNRLTAMQLKLQAKETKVGHRQPEPLTPQRSLGEKEFEEHMRKVESSESQNPPDKKAPSEGATSRKQRGLSLSRGSEHQSESAKGSPIIQRLVGIAVNVQPQ